MTIKIKQDATKQGIRIRLDKKEDDKGKARLINQNLKNPITITVNILTKTRI